MSGISRRAFVQGAGAMAATFGLAACGGQQSGQGGEPSDANGPTDSTKITFCLDYTPNTNHTGIYVAQAKGFFDEEGLDVTIVQPAEDTAEAMIGTGQAQLGVSYQDYIANALTGGNTNIEAVAAIVQHNTSGIMSRASDGITHPAAMEGHTYATWDLPVEQATIKQVVEKDGGDFGKVKLVPYTVEDDVAGLRANMYDAVWVYEGWAVQNATLQDLDINYFSFISVDEVFDYYTPVIAANVTYAQQNASTVKAFLRAVKKGYEFAIAQPEESAAILCEAVPELDAELVAQSQLFLSTQYQADAASWGVIQKDRWARFYTWLVENSLVDGELDVNSGWTMEYMA